MMKRIILTSLGGIGFCRHGKGSDGAERLPKRNTVPMAIPVNRNW